MALSSHIEELKKKHQSLDHTIEVELRSPGSSDLKIADLKRQKLRLKDEITRIGHTAH